MALEVVEDSSISELVDRAFEPLLTEMVKSSSHVELYLQSFV